MNDKVLLWMEGEMDGLCNNYTEILALADMYEKQICMKSRLKD